MKDYDEVALQNAADEQNASDEAICFAEFVSSWVAGGGWAGDAAQAWGEYWAEPVDDEAQEADAEAAAPQGGEVWW